MAVPGINQIDASLRYALALRSVLREPLTLEQSRDQIARALAQREDVFLSTAENGIFTRDNVYRRLFDNGGIGFADLRGLVAEHGIEGALKRLFDAGIYVTAQELKGMSPIRRPGLELNVRATDFDNPRAGRHFRGQTSGSSGRPAQAFIGFELMKYEAAHYTCLYEGFGVAERPVAMWHPALHTALKTMFRHAKRGRIPEKWFTPSPFRFTLSGVKEQYVVALSVVVGRVLGRPLPRSEFVPRGEVMAVVNWLAGKAASGAPAVLETNHSSAVRVCLAAREADRDISGTTFHLTGEPLTAAKAQVLTSSGTRAMNRYANVEVGVMGIACADGSTHDDVHFLSDKLALITQPHPEHGGTESLVMTSIEPSSPQLWFNVVNGDYASVTNRACGCPFGQLGLNTHLTDIRAFDKLTSEGVTFRVHQLFDLLERVLPSRFGGGPTDYQLVEDELDGVSRVNLVVRESIGLVDQGEVLDCVYQALESYNRTMAMEWRQADVLRIERGAPRETASAKILPLVVNRRDQ